jgi:hypothetical protein
MGDVGPFGAHMSKSPSRDFALRFLLGLPISFLVAYAAGSAFLYASAIIHDAVLHRRGLSDAVLFGTISFVGVVIFWVPGLISSLFVTVCASVGFRHRRLLVVFASAVLPAVVFALFVPGTRVAEQIQELTLLIPLACIPAYACAAAFLSFLFRQIYAPQPPPIPKGT